MRRNGPWALAALSLWACSSPSSTSSSDDHVGTPGADALSQARICRIARSPCSPETAWPRCRQARDQCARWARLRQDRALASELCDQLHLASCAQLCGPERPDACARVALIELSGAGHAEVPATLAELREPLAVACRAGDAVSCAAMGLAYAGPDQIAVAVMRRCEDEPVNCLASACEQRDALACALLCHRGDGDGCRDMALLAFGQVGFRYNVSNWAGALLHQRCMLTPRDAQACTLLGAALQRGLGLKVDIGQARDYYIRGCPADAAACSHLATLHLAGLGVRRDATRAAGFFDQACQGGYLPACTALAKLYSAGLGVQADPRQAEQLLRLACDGGQREACTMIEEPR